jgi:hypothetical protein
MNTFDSLEWAFSFLPSLETKKSVNLSTRYDEMVDQRFLEESRVCRRHTVFITLCIVLDVELIATVNRSK